MLKRMGEDSGGLEHRVDDPVDFAGIVDAADIAGVVEYHYRI